jgi:hypothetical protein
LQDDTTTRNQAFQTCYETYSLAYETSCKSGSPSATSHKILFDWGNAYYRHATCLLLERSNQLDDINGILEEAPKAPLTLSAEACYNTAFELLLQAAEHYRAAVDCRQDFLVAFINHGHALKSMLLCKTRSEEQQQFFEQHARMFLQQFQDFIPILGLYTECCTEQQPEQQPEQQHNINY